MNKTNVGASLDTIHFLIDIFMLIFSYSITVLIFFTQLNEVQIMQLLLICTIYSIIYLLSNRDERLYNVTVFF